MPMNWRITPSPPARATAPVRTGRSPATIRSSVVLPAPFGPTRATLAPSPTRNDTSAKSSRPSGRMCPTAATSTYPTPGSCPSGGPGGTSRLPGDPQHPEALLAGVPLDLPALVGQPALQRVAAEVPGDHQPGRRRPGRVGAASAAAARAARPCRSGSAGWTRSGRSVTSAGTSSGAPTRTRSAAPTRAALAAVSSRARALTSTAQTVAAGATSASTQAIGPNPQPRSSRSPPVSAVGQVGLAQQHRGARVEPAGGEDPAGRGEPVVAVGDGELDLARPGRRWRAQR